MTGNTWIVILATVLVMLILRHLVVTLSYWLADSIIKIATKAKQRVRNIVSRRTR